jgi:hypothetical protein
MYERLFEPRFVGRASGLKDAPRAFVLRVRKQHLRLSDPFEFGFHLFDPRQPLEPIEHAFDSFVRVERIEGRDLVKLSLDPCENVRRVRVTFLTPTELKGSSEPEPGFGLLFARIRDRVSTLRALYQEGPLDIDFKSMGERAALVKTTRCEIRQVEARRTSRRTGQTHSLGGFTGIAEYEGDLGEFLPYLEIARWTGVGRQTVWGKGEIACETY